MTTIPKGEGRMTQWRYRVGLGVLGLVILGVYLTTTLGLLRSDSILMLIPVLAIGPVAIVGILSIHNRLVGFQDGLLLRAGTVFLVVAFALFTLMVVIQQTVLRQFQDMRAQADAPATVELLRSIQGGVNLVQLGADVAFDVFYCLGMILYGAVFYRTAGFGRLLGVGGIVAAGGLLAMNLASFPYVPAESGLVDLGPVTGAWWVLVILRLIRWNRGDRNVPIASPAA
jgi:hypothetical protein